MKKNRLCSLVVIVLLVAACMTASAEGEFYPVAIEPTVSAQRAACEHEYLVYENAAPYKEGYESIGDINHAYFEYYRGVCRLCGSVGTVVITETPAQHSWIYTGQNQHEEDRNRHRYFYECNVCKESREDTLPCPGTGNGDCIIMIIKSINPVAK